MLIDVLNALGDLVLPIVGAGILLFATYRAFTIGRLLIRGAFRTRASWTGGTAVALILFIYAAELPSSNPLSVLSFFVIVIILLAFVDSSIRVEQEMDFFHISPMNWQRFRKPLYAAYVAITVVAAVILFYESLSNAFILLFLIWLALAAIILGYSAAALVVGARRTPDRSMRRFVRMLGWTIVCMVLFFTTWIPFAPFSVTVQDVGSTFSTFFIPAAAYFLYQAVMSLSPIGRIEKETAS